MEALWRLSRSVSDTLCRACGDGDLVETETQSHVETCGYLWEMDTLWLQESKDSARPAKR